MRKAVITFAALAIAAGAAVSTVLAAGDGELEAARDRIAGMLPEIDRNNINPAPVPGLFEVRKGASLAYVSADGRFLVQGEIIDLEGNRNLTEERRSGARLAALKDVGEGSMVIFGPRNASRTITVFTDIDCGYCRKLHRQIDDYNARGIAVRYLFFPRSGPDTESWEKARNVWCAKDRNSALTRAKAGEKIVSPDCGSTPVAEHYELGLNFGLRGTPAIVTDSGEMIGGYVPPAELAKRLGAGSASGG